MKKFIFYKKWYATGKKEIIKRIPDMPIPPRCELLVFPTDEGYSYIAERIVK